MRGLMLHMGAQNATEGAVRAVETPAPTATHFPIPHEVLLDHAIKLVARHGLKIDSLAHGLDEKRGKYFGLLEVSPVESGAVSLAGTDGAGHVDGTVLQGKDYATVIGLRNSHDKSMAAGLTVGSHVFVCDNLAFSGEVTMQRAHTKFIMRDLPQLVEAAMGKLMSLRGHQDLRIQTYKDALINDRDADHLIMQGYRAGVIPTSKIGPVWKEWEKPSHEDFSPRTVWSLFNAHTEVLKTSRGQIFDKPRFTQALHGVMDTAAGLAPLVLGTEKVGEGELVTQPVGAN